MSYELKNTLKGPSTIRITGVDTTGALALTAFSANQALENVNSLVITSMKYSLLQTTGTLTITRGSVVVATLYGTGEWKHDEHAIANTANGTITVALAGGGTGMLTIRKDATYNVPAMQLW
jgi:hypothetical protein